MKKTNIFRSSSFWMDEGDVLHISIIDETGTPITLNLQTEYDDNTTDEGETPLSTVATDATDITETSFTTNWYFGGNCEGYYLDVSVLDDFSTRVTGYDGLDVSNVNTYPVSGLVAGMNYYYRVRGYNTNGAGTNSNTITVTTTAATVPITFKQVLVRNAELDNSLAIADSTLLAITNKVGVVLTVANLPDYDEFDTAGWAVILIDEDKTSTVDPTPTGDYSYRNFCTVDRVAKTLTFAGGTNLTAWEVGDNIALYHPFLNYDFVGDQTTNPIVSITGAPAWRATSTLGGPMFRHSDGRFIMLLNGYSSGSPSIIRIGYIESADMTTWTIGNTDNYIFGPEEIADTKHVYACGNAYPCNDGTGRYWCCVMQSRLSDNKGAPRILYFDEDLTTFTYSDPILPDVENGYYGCSVIEVSPGNFHLITLLIPTGFTGPTCPITAYRATTLEGPYTSYQTIVIGQGSNDGVAWSYSTDAAGAYFDGTTIRAFFGGQSMWSESGTKGNKEYCMATMDINTQVWTVSPLGPVVINPMYYFNMGGNYLWCNDHIGAYPSFFTDETTGKVYMSLTMRGGAYQMALVELK